MMQTLAKLKSFELKDILKIETSNLGLRKIVITSPLAKAEIYLHGAHLTHYQPTDAEALIFNGTQSRVSPPHSVHAGIPICWPWFGAHPSESSKPQHGFARDRVWRLKSTQVKADNEVEVLLELQDDETTKTLFPYTFRLELALTIGKKLTLALTTHNTDTKPFTITQALHTYFAISDIEAVRITGVEGTPFVDYTDHKKVKSESGILSIHQEINRVYVPTDRSCKIIDPVMGRQITVEKSGSNSTTIWNPWRESRIHDLPDEKYRQFVCVETTNALDDAVTLQPENSHTLTQSVSAIAL